jgi:hypothetical protein
MSLLNAARVTKLDELPHFVWMQGIGIAADERIDRQAVDGGRGTRFCLPPMKIVMVVSWFSGKWNFRSEPLAG